MVIKTDHLKDKYVGQCGKVIYVADNAYTGGVRAVIRRHVIIQLDCGTRIPITHVGYLCDFHTDFWSLVVGDRVEIVKLKTDGKSELSISILN